MIASKEMKAHTFVILLLLGLVFLVPKLAALQNGGLGSPVISLVKGR